jgi:hypothetical protein
LLNALLWATRIETQPSGVLEGINALIWSCRTYSGIAFMVLEPRVTLMDTPFKVVPSGKDATCTPVAGPKAEPKRVKMDPRAIEPAGRAAKPQ